MHILFMFVGERNSGFMWVNPWSKKQTKNMKHKKQLANQCLETTLGSE